MSRKHVVAVWIALGIQLALLLTLWLCSFDRGQAIQMTDHDPRLHSDDGAALASLRQRIAALEARTSTIEVEEPERIQRIETPPTTSSVSPQVMARLTALEKRVAKLQSPGAIEVGNIRWGNPPPAKGITAAAARGDRAAVLKALRSGKSLEETDDGGFTVLTSAIRGGHEDLALELIGRGANVNAIDGGGETPLMWAAYRGQEKAARRLLDRGARQDVFSKTKNSALHDAVRSGNVKVVELLLQRGANVDHVDAQGKTPLMLAKERGRAKVAVVLRRFGAR